MKAQTHFDLTNVQKIRKPIMRISKAGNTRPSKAMNQKFFGARKEFAHARRNKEAITILTTIKNRLVTFLKRPGIFEITICRLLMPASKYPFLRHSMNETLFG